MLVCNTAGAGLGGNGRVMLVCNTAGAGLGGNGRVMLVCNTAGAGLIYFNLTGRTMPKGISIGEERTIILSINAELEKVNYLAVDYTLHTLEVNYLCCWFHVNYLK